MTITEKRQTDEACSRWFVGSIMCQAFSPLVCGVWRRGLRGCSRSRRSRSRRVSTIVAGYRKISDSYAHVVASYGPDH